MSDSDDTNVLLLIPPNFFIAEEEEDDESFCSNEFIEFESINETQLMGMAPLHSYDNSNQTIYKNNMSSQCPNNNNNAKQQTIMNRSKQHYLSTSKVATTSTRENSFSKDESSFIKEIDHYFQENQSCGSHHHNVSQKKDSKQLAMEALEKHNSLMSQKYDYGKMPAATSHIDTKQSVDGLLSLNELWGPHDSSGLHQQPSYTLVYQEEKMRRQHCEKTIQTLQSRLLEFQQKIAIAMKVDKKKDSVLVKLHENNSILQSRIDELEKALAGRDSKAMEATNRLENENFELKKKLNTFETELGSAIGMAKKFQDQNEVLAIKADNLNKTTNEIRDIHRKQLEDLEIRASNYKHNEKLMVHEIEQLREKNSKLESDLQKSKHLAYEKFHEEKQRAESLETHKKSMQVTIDSMADKEKHLRKDFEAQKITLKSYYQQQLEQAVLAKVKEFQKQLDSVEDTLKQESKQRERLIAERAIKQLELISKKNDQEFSLMNERHTQEIELYRIQLVNASRTIQELQDKVGAYHSKRTHIAERLHSVMETQWQRALEILTNPNDESSLNNDDPPAAQNYHRPIDASKLDKEKADGIAGLYNHHHQPHRTRPENESYQTPDNDRKLFHADARTIVSNTHEDKLQAYIDLLLKKSPGDLDCLDRILDMPKKNKTLTKSTTGEAANSLSNHEQSHGGKRDHRQKNPWK